MICLMLYKESLAGVSGAHLRICRHSLSTVSERLSPRVTGAWTERSTLDKFQSHSGQDLLTEDHDALGTEEGTGPK